MLYLVLNLLQLPFLGDDVPPPVLSDSDSDREIAPIPDPFADVLDRPLVDAGPQRVIYLAPAPPVLPIDMVSRAVFDELTRQCAQLRGRAVALQSVVDSLVRGSSPPLLGASAGVRIRAMVRDITSQLRRLQMVDEDSRNRYIERMVESVVYELTRILEG